MELRQLNYFRAVAQSGSFSRASAQLAVAQPALSRQVRKLEDELKVPLLYRNGRGVTLTEAGRMFLGRIERILGDLEQLSGEMAEQQGALRGTLTIGLPPALSGVLAAPLLHRARQAMPHVHIHVIDGFSGHLKEWLVSRRVDMAVLYSAGLPRSVIAEPLLAEYLFLIGMPAHPLCPKQPGQTLKVREMAGLPLVLPGQRHALRREVDRAAASAGIKLDVQLEVDALQAIKELVMEGRYFSVLPFGGIHAQVASRQMRAWRLVAPAATNQMMLAMSGERPVTAAMRELGRAVRAEIGALTASGTLAGRRSGGRPHAKAA